MRFSNRVEAGRQLADVLGRYEGDERLLVLGLPRGGVPVAAEVANALNAELDLLIVRKLGVPGQEELAMGAVATGGALVLNEDLIKGLGITADYIDAALLAEERELKRREKAYRGERPLPTLAGRHLLVVDDGVATGATMRAAVKALRQHWPAKITVAVPVAPPDTVLRLREDADDVVCLSSPAPFYGVGAWYEDFSQTTDEEVRSILSHAWHDLPQPRPPGSVDDRREGMRDG
ncbi:phosphoribosyltransferase [Alkalilimnicola ehrlichii]|uniref:Phosphoribosyltransferase n=1 Tax=Alkalilimnicola ehrlichii TaxID=351052 RepID=A0A3E0X1F9_9GAMM|nr:phosphoribosyltransferase [Alkalilimnicola ehrlichii]RFA30586.1 phosphoribosyltransferase [Alkalilimnicola ehrlichii]RFA38136.1 phosphoribosyltransferase [Alkalilimnicola ehrlichii]